ncbi:cyclic peptide export ABC transporter [Thalassomonas viridans]|uniref:Cyclic peptide export ABC transporter n=1 Tax=Thalassomonas viridans TaxID=137584 RepID=A0AAF0CFK2_9GAMM|nr:cyclic peptide export ABC transporter [Thalassomonas viridans]WDE09239.1 cyclic peptide export ABC transporter [Thalassomonas viridans]
MNQISEKNLKGLFKFLSTFAPGKVFLSIVAGMLSGLAYSLVIPLIMMSIKENDDLFISFESAPSLYIGDFEITQPGFVAGFIALCLFILVSKIFSQAIFNTVVVSSLSQLRLFLTRRIAQLPIQDLERIGEEKLLVTFTMDIPRIANGAAVFPQLLINLASILGILGFLLVLDVDIFLLVVMFMLVGMLVYRIPLWMGHRYLAGSRNAYEHIQERFNGIIRGAKELKLNRSKRESFIDQLGQRTEADYARLQIKGTSMVIGANNFGNLLSLFAIGFITFALSNYLNMSQELLTATIMAVLYIAGPMNTLMNLITPMLVGRVSLKKINELLPQMPVERQNGSGAVRDFSRLRLCNIRHSYDNKDSFAVGPLDITLKAGQITFITGGNGSGKSTLSKIISGHYIATEGEIFYDRQHINDDNRDNARQYISAIYTDYHLFARLLDMTPEKEEIVNHYLKEFGMADKVRIEDGAFSTIKLSDGQRKRLALIVSYLEDRKVYLLDEWAADQDPAFREIFYMQILPELKQRGKIVVVVSHDDKYFSQADQIIKMETGQLVYARTREDDRNGSGGEKLASAG